MCFFTYHLQMVQTKYYSTLTAVILRRYQQRSMAVLYNVIDWKHLGLLR